MSVLQAILRMQAH